MSSPSEKKTFIVASHAHWDREWYRPFQEFRLRLVEMVDELIGLMDDEKSGYRFFNLDGQTVVLEDYLALKPENKDKLKALISSGKLLVGPWYILPDEFLVSGESYIHNLLIGKDLCEEFGHFPKVGYLPDCFGHIGQIPQILDGFGIDNVIIWRGLSLDRPYPEIYWEGADGTKVFGLHMVHSYADACTGFFTTLQEKIDKFKNVIDFYHTSGQASSAMMMNGVDHMPVDLDTPELIKQLNADDSLKAELRQGTFEEYIDLLRKEQSYQWPTFKGMLRDTKLHDQTGTIVLNGVLSSRMYLKQMNVKMQHRLVRWAEPAAVMEQLFHGCDRRPFLRKAWTRLLRNHPHDSIGGCSIDRVHRQMMTRYEWVEDICDSIVRRTVHKMAAGKEYSETLQYQLAVFNPMPFAVSDMIEAEITIPKPHLDPKRVWSDGVGFNSTRPIRGIRMRRSNGEPIDVQLLDITEKTIPYPQLREIMPHRICNVIKVRFWAKDLPSLGYEKLEFELLNAPVYPTRTMLTAQNVMENRYLKVKVNCDGTLSVTDKENGKTFDNLLYFEDGGDCGDEYTYSVPNRDRVISTQGAPAQISVTCNGADSCSMIIEQTLMVPEDMKVDPFAAMQGSDPMQERSDRLIALSIRSEITLGKEAKHLTVKTTVDNQAKWHRLRVMFDTYLKADFAQAEQQYYVDDLPIDIRQPATKVWIEDQPMQYPQQDFVDVSDGKAGLAILNKGLPEFEVTPRESRTIAVTLLRCVGWLSRGQMNARYDNAGPSIETPEAQCLGTHTFEYAIYPHKGDWVEGRVLPLARQFNGGVETFTPIPSHVDTETKTFSLLSLEGTAIALDACKPAERYDGVIVRLTNYSNQPQKASLKINFPFNRVNYANLDETVLDDKPTCSNGKVELTIGARKIVTLAIQ